MKKLFVAVALVMGLGASVSFAGNVMNNVEASVTTNEFTPIEIKDLPQAVKDTIAKDYAKSTIKEAFVEVKEDDTTKTYKVVLVNEIGVENTYFFSADGKEVK